MLATRRAVLLALVVALSAAGCRSTSPTAAQKAAAQKAAASDGFTVGESQFMNTGPWGDCPPGSREAPSRSAEPAQVLRPENPWIGTVGLSTSITDSMKFGFGIEVPNPVDERQPTAALTDRLRDTGVGAWVSFDF